MDIIIYFFTALGQAIQSISWWDLLRIGYLFTKAYFVVTMAYTMLKNMDTTLKFGANPHRADTKAFTHYERVRVAKTVKEAKEFGVSQWDLKKWTEGGSI